MNASEVKYEISGPASQISSPKFVLNEAARAIRLNAFLYGTMFGLIVAIILIIVFSKIEVKQGADNGTLITGRGRGSGAEGTVPANQSAVVAPNSHCEYAYAIDEDNFVPVKRIIGASQVTGTIADGSFFITSKHPNGDALTLPEDITESWTSPQVYSASRKKSMPLQLKDGSWWSESRSAYMPWGKSNEKPDPSTFDDVHKITVPLINLSSEEQAIVSGRPLKRFHDFICIFSDSRNGFVPLRCPVNPQALWDESSSKYTTANGETWDSETVYPNPSDSHQSQESNS